MAQSAPPSQAIARIPVMDTVRFAYAVVFGNLRDFLRAAIVPGVLLWSIGLMAGVLSEACYIHWASRGVKQDKLRNEPEKGEPLPNHQATHGCGDRHHDQAHGDQRGGSD